MKRDDFVTLPVVIGDEDTDLDECLENPLKGSIEYVSFRKDLIWHWHRSVPDRKDNTKVYVNKYDPDYSIFVLMGIEELEQQLFGV